MHGKSNKNHLENNLETLFVFSLIIFESVENSPSVLTGIYCHSNVEEVEKEGGVSNGISAARKIDIKIINKI